MKRGATHRRWCMLALAGPLAVGAVPAGTGDCPQLLVNSETIGREQRPDLLVRPDGSFVVVWDRRFSNEYDIRARIFSADDTARGPEFLVNTSTGSFHVPAVEVAPDGGFAVAMQVAEGDLRLRRYDADGLPLGSELEIPSWSAGYPKTPDLGFRADGEFAVVWRNKEDPYGRGHVRGHRLDAAGGLRGRAFQIDCLEAYRPYRRYPAVEATPAGEFLVVWESEDDDIDGPNGIYRCRLDEEFSFVFTDDFESGDTGAWASTVP